MLLLELKINEVTNLVFITHSSMNKMNELSLNVTGSSETSKDQRDHSAFSTSYLYVKENSGEEGGIRRQGFSWRKMTPDCPNLMYYCLAAEP